MTSETKAAASGAWCSDCIGYVVPARAGTCPWCDTDLTSPPPEIDESMQRATEATTLLHLTEPREWR